MLGLFPYSGTNYLNLSANLTITITFDSPQVAFGFYGTDLETNLVLLTLVTSNQGDMQLTAPVTVPQGSGGAFFFGVIAPGTPFTAVRLSNTGSQPEDVALDRMTIANLAQVLPRPTLTILGSATAICWDTVRNAGYQLQFTTNLAGGVWAPLNTGYYPGNGSLLCTNDYLPTPQPKRFYRVAVTNSIP